MKINEILLLFRVQLLGFFGANQSKKSKDGKGKKKARSFTYMAAVSTLALGYFSFQYSFMIAQAIQTVGGSPEILPALMGFACCVMVLISTLLKASPTLFGSGDTDMLMSLPVTSGSIIASRILVIYTMDFLYTAALLLPLGIVYVLNFHPPVLGIVLFVFLFFIVPFLPCVLGCVLGTIIEIFTAKFGRSNLLRNILSVLLLVAVMTMSFTLSSSSMEKSAETYRILSEKAVSIYPVLRLFIQAFCGGRVLPFLAFTAVSVVPFVLFCRLVGSKFRFFVGVVNARKSGRSYKLSTEKNGSPFKALYRKEVKRFFSCNIYFMNFGVGMIMALLATVAAVVFRSRILDFAAESGMSTTVFRALPFALSLFVCLSTTSACSISLEGRSFSLIRSLPIDAKDFLRAKIAVNLTVTGLPALLCGTVLAVAFRLPAVEFCACVLLPVLYSALTAVLGLTVNLRFPMLDWKSEVTPVKQSASTFIAVVGFMPLTVVPAIAVLFFEPIYPIAAGTLAAVLALTAFLCYRHTMNTAEAKIRKIGE
ncbi:MAG TPA: hypothetical protein DDY98_01625 [Ruminococcaceae bacterium]|nr:hypothetical protein [Oscillospiraceae bacterium]